ncbi:hypothetical protein Tco_1314304 [Tanacetum coccineum]
MAYTTNSSRSDTEVQSCSKNYVKTYEKLQKQFDEQRQTLSKANLEIVSPRLFCLGLKVNHLPPASRYTRTHNQQKLARDFPCNTECRGDHCRFRMKKRSCSLEQLTTGRLIDGSSCGGIDMVIKDLDLEPKIDAMMWDFLDIASRFRPQLEAKEDLFIGTSQVVSELVEKL